jgi:hypothetical protein
MRNLHALLALAAALCPGLASALPDENRPNVLERLEARFEKNPELRKLTQGPPEPMQRVKWMTGKWDVSLTQAATGRTPQKVDKGTRETSFELGGRWLISRNTMSVEKSEEFIAYDPFGRNWYWQFFSSAGRGTNAALLGTSGWDEGTLKLEGTFSVYEESANITLFIKKLSANEYVEVFTEILPDGTRLPILEYNYTRQAAASNGPARKPTKK